MRIVIDTNLLISGVISAGLPRQLVDAAKAGEFELCTSEVLLVELLDVSAHPPSARQVARAHRYRHQVPPAVRRPDRLG